MHGTGDIGEYFHSKINSNNYFIVFISRTQSLLFENFPKIRVVKSKFYANSGVITRKFNKIQQFIKTLTHTDIEIELFFFGQLQNLAYIPQILSHRKIP